MPLAPGYETLLSGSVDKRHPGALIAVVDHTIKAKNTDTTQVRVPPALAPVSASPAEHLEFALKHQGVSLSALENICLDLDPSIFQKMVHDNPDSRYARIAGAVFEQFTGKSLEYKGVKSGYTELFNPGDYLCGSPNKVKKYRILFNGLGTPAFSPIIRRSPGLDALLSRNFQSDLENFIESVGGEKNLDRAIGWAYLDETRGSFDLEREGNKAGRAKMFLDLLRRAQEQSTLTEDYLCQLQQSIAMNPLTEEFSFRHKQNWLQRGASRFTASSISYLPPPPELLPALMAEFLGIANRTRDETVDPLVMANLLSFAFVFLHPFMDGNGRVSRFLVHQQLCRSNVLKNGLILPVSVEMKQHETEYLNALQSVSSPLRNLWDVMVIDESNIDGVFRARSGAYRYWDATQCVEFGVRMTHGALDHALIGEVEFLRKFDRVKEAINATHGVRDNDLTTLVRCAVDNGGVISMNRRKQFSATVDQDTMDDIEREVEEAFFPPSN